MKVEWVPLDRVLQTRTGEPVDPTESYPIAGVLGFGRGLLMRDPMLGADTKYKTFTRLSSGDVVYSKVKAFEGAATVVPSEGDGYWVSPEFPVFAPHVSAVDPRYLNHYVASEDFQLQLQQQSSGIGARRERVSPARFLGLTLPLPPLADQSRIAAHLDRVSHAATTDSSHQVTASLEALNLAGSSGESKRVGDLVSRVSRPFAVKDGHEYRMHGVKWHGGGLFERERRLGRELSSKTVHQVFPGDLVYNRLFAWKRSFALAPDDVSEAFVSNEFPTFRVDEEVLHPEVLLALLLGPDVTHQVDEASTGNTSTSRNRLKEGPFLDLKVRVPAPGEQEALVRQLRARERALELAEQRERLAGALLPAARNEIFSAMR